MQPNGESGSIEASKPYTGVNPTMPIVKETSSRLLKIQHPYEVISRDVVQSITNPIALAIHTYLLTKPDGWIVRKNEILSHFEGLGSDRYIAAMKHLNERGLYSTAITRNELGQIVDKVIIISAIPENNHQDGENPILGKTQHTENPTNGKSPRIEIQRVIKDTEIVKYTETGVVGFEDFYDSYPKKVGKDDALKAWKKLNPNENLIKGILLDIQQRVAMGHWCTGKGKAYIPGPAPYLNQKKWRDEIIPRPDFKLPQDFSKIAREAQEI